MKHDSIPSSHTLVTQEISVDTLAEKYLKNNETTQTELFERVARAIASVEVKTEADKYYEIFLDNLHKGGIGAGRIMSAAGTDIKSTLINCFVQPVGDCIQGVDDEGFPGIYEALREAAETMRRGGGVGYDFSRIRPRGAYVKGTASVASGPCSYINVFDQSCSTVESAGARRGAQMGVLRIDHPDVLEFITAKRTPGRWNNFNVSVAVTNEFMQAVENGDDWQLVHKATPTAQRQAAGAYKLEGSSEWVYETIPARSLWETIMQSTYDFAEPGILFMSNINNDNNLRYCEAINATNPCGEQPLPSYGCCDLGPIILTKFVKNPFGFEGHPHFDFDGFASVVATQVRMLDNVLDLTFWPLDAQKKESDSKRRIGVGFTGLGNALAMLAVKYNSPAGVAYASKIAEVMRNAAYEASVNLATERGCFPLFDAAKYLEEGTFASRLPESLKELIREFGIRNSHLLSIAPTGTVSLAFADNASNGIEPPFSWVYDRKKRMADGSTSMYSVEDHSWRMFKHLGGDVNNLPEYFVNALEMTAQEHLDMMGALQPFVDSAISKTINVPGDYPFSDFKDLYMKAWRLGLKGVATYRPNSILGSVLSVPVVATAPVEEAPKPAPAAVAAPVFDPMRSVIETRPNGSLAAVSEKIEYWTHEGKKTLYLLVSFLPVASADGLSSVDRAIEFFMPVGQSGESQQWMTSTMRILSLAARGGFLDRALSDMRKVAWDRGPVRLGRYMKADGTQIPMHHDSEVAAIAFAIQNIIDARQKAHAADEWLHGELVMDSENVQAQATPVEKSSGAATMTGKKCSECGAHAVIRRDGCEFCTHCGNLGSCG